MMLYIFHVDTGTMMTFDMNLALESVEQLKEVIERACQIPVEKQVLLVSGGESLDPTARVASYSAGTDTNPIYLFSKSTIESSTPPTLSIDYGSDISLKEQVEGSYNLPDTYKTVVARVQLAQQFCELAREQTRICECLVHDQHLQQQGWAAVLANLEDSTSAFQARADLFEQSFMQYLETREEFMTLLQNFRDDLDVLAKIPIIPVLLDTLENATSESSNSETSNKEIKESTEECENKDEDSAVLENNAENSECNSLEPKKHLSLLEWISAKDNQSSLQQVAEHCIKGLQEFDDRVIESLKAEVEHILSNANKTDMKEIKGLEERLYGLEQLMFETKNIVQEQTDLAQSFLQNQTRANNLGDPSILPDLCTSHRRQLQVMLSNQQHLLDIRGRCTRAKEELCRNLHMRLKWVMFVENRMCDVNGKLVIYHENLKRLRRHLDVIQQIHLAPQMYVAAVGEVVRRRTFSQAFLFWSNDLACQLLAVHNDEVARRRDFQSQFGGHFLSTLFPGMEDVPPAFATQAPSIFDSSLPKLSVDDIDLLKKELPELTASLSLPDLESITQFFLSKSISVTLKSSEKDDVTALEDQLVKAVAEVRLSSSLDTELLQPVEIQIADPSLSSASNQVKEHDRGFESETDTEEFEKVGQSPLEPKFDAKQTAPVLGSEPVTSGPSSSAVPSLEENLGNTRNEVERLRGVIQAISRLAYDTITILKDELALLRSKTTRDRDEMITVCCNLISGLQRQRKCFEEAQIVNEKDLIHRITVDHELELDAFKQEMKSVLDSKEEEIKSLKQTVECKEEELVILRNDMEKRLEEEVCVRKDVKKSLESQLADCRSQCEEMQRRLEGEEEEKSRALKEQFDELNRTYKADLESLRSRFRRATAMMERSPSDSSLERIERADVTAEREAAVQAAVEQERARWEAKLEHELKVTRSRVDAEKQVWFNEAMRRVVSEKDRQIDMLKTREVALSEECRRHEETIRQFIDDRESGGPKSLGALPSSVVNWQQTAMSESEHLDSGKDERTVQSPSEGEDRRVATPSDMSASVSLVESSSRDATTSPDHSHTRRPSRDDVILRDKLTRSQTTLVQEGKISISSCNIGDAILVVWDEEHRNYMILQEASTHYFLHLDCLETLGLKPGSDGSPKKYYSTGEVAEKEYCSARKPENRYRVPVGTKFYRVKVKPLQRESSILRSQRRHHHHHHQSSTTLVEEASK